MTNDQIFSNYETCLAKIALDNSVFGSIHNVVDMYNGNVFGLALFLKELYIEQTPDIPFPYNDMLRYAIDRISFEELAERYLEEVDN